MRRLFPALSVLCLLFAPSFLGAAEKPVENLLPASCARGWVIDGKVSTYTRENLYRHIDGEAELYMPYGLQQAATALYVRPADKSGGLVVNVFEMGSLLDAYGIYGNYRSPESEQIRVGGEGFIEETQLMFFQDRYFVQIMISGNLSQERPIFLECAAAISRVFPPGKAKPPEIAFLNVPGLVPMTEKYFAEGLLGYGFFGRGLTAEATLKGARVKVFVAMGDSDDAIKRLFAEYAKYLGESKVTPQVSGDGHARTLRAIDPLYKGVFLRQSGRYAVGVAGLSDESSDGANLVGQLIERLQTRSSIRACSRVPTRLSTPGAPVHCPR